MRIYNFPKRLTEDYGVQFQPIDLEYIVSISEILYLHYPYNKKAVGFTIFIKIGEPIDIIYEYGDFRDFKNEITYNLFNERQKLIDAWVNEEK